ncbi:hypothetical protein LGN12_12945 [Burkholderia multivorans]|uniref:hypothetical protein n=1 Tax=Burkholderia multivorans TaxID=87883 RepID=UPI001C21D58D|nr:hypothetical protein [Burkholderia multivorans]MBU9608258.1 hypothetical protein [Burkholderia multivorans]MCA8248066.1 hypothetical protein [Burkholderia multivorans]
MDNDHLAQSFRVCIVWLGSLAGTLLARVEAYLTLSNVVLTATLIYTVLQIYVLVRDKIVRRRREG